MHRLFNRTLRCRSMERKNHLPKQHPEVIETMSKHAKKLTEGEYNARTTASYIMNDFIRITQ